MSDCNCRRGASVRHGGTRARGPTFPAAAAFLTPVSVLCLGAPDAFWAVLIMSVLMFAHGFWMTNYMTVIGDLFPSASLGTVVGLTGTAGGPGGALSGLVIGRVVEAFSFTPVFLACGVLYPIGLVLILFPIPTVEKLHRRAD